MSNKEEKQVQNALEQMEERDGALHQAELLKENKMGTMPVDKLLFNVSIPIVISMLVQALYNVVDSIFVARLGEEALAAVGLVFPVQNLMIAVAVGTGVGISSRLGRRLGEQNIESVNRTATNGIFVMALSWVAFALLGLFGTNFFMSAFTSGSPADAQIARMGADYMYIVTIGSLGIFISITMERFLQATGRSMYSMAAQLTGAIINIALDPLLIFGIGPFPRMEVAGAALATVIGQWGSMAVGIFLCVTRNPEVNFSFRRFRPNPKTIKHIYQVGLPSIIMQSISSVMTYGMNLILIGFGTTPVTIFSIYFKLQSFIFMPVFGFNNGMVPIIAFNYGAKKRQRITRAVRLCLIINVCIMAAGTLIFCLIPGPLLKLFDATPNMMEIGVTALRIISISFPAAALAITLSGSFQALGKGGYSLIMSCIRQLIFILPVAWLLARTLGLAALWWAFPLSEISSTVLALVFYRRMYNNMIKPLGSSAALPE